MSLTGRVKDISYKFKVIIAFPAFRLVSISQTKAIALSNLCCRWGLSLFHFFSKLLLDLLWYEARNSANYLRFHFKKKVRGRKTRVKYLLLC